MDGSRENLLFFRVSSDIGVISSITSHAKFVQYLFSVERTIWCYIFTEHFKKNYPMGLYESLGTPFNAKLD